jgi:hypothetical protein
MTTATKHLSSTGYVCQMLQATPSKIEAAARRIEVGPDTVINGVSHWTDEQIEAIREELRGKQGNGVS